MDSSGDFVAASNQSMWRIRGGNENHDNVHHDTYLLCSLAALGLRQVLLPAPDYVVFHQVHSHQERVNRSRDAWEMNSNRSPLLPLFSHCRIMLSLQAPMVLNDDQWGARMAMVDPDLHMQHSCIAKEERSRPERALIVRDAFSILAACESQSDSSTFDKIGIALIKFMNDHDSRSALTEIEGLVRQLGRAVSDVSKFDPVLRTLRCLVHREGQQELDPRLVWTLEWVRENVIWKELLQGQSTCGDTLWPRIDGGEPDLSTTGSHGYLAWPRCAVNALRREITFSV
mmetsp:Transcript_17797/g.27504  ORF Transcript_17797/g.27504 Transcript_17797/m.27504 type:complete len:286 (-) Transcript_17797:402-1259(-)